MTTTTPPWRGWLRIGGTHHPWQPVTEGESYDEARRLLDLHPLVAAARHVDLTVLPASDDPNRRRIVR